GCNPTSSKFIHTWLRFGEIMRGSLSTRHAQMMQENLFVAGSISTQELSVANLQGVQFTGTVSLLTDNDDIRARKQYCLRFPVALAAIHVPLWQLQLQEIKMVNNQLGFGTKLFWQRH
ncbi:hypothetical protein NFG36_18405, partial [Proteus mirabilis]|nr:hypothetical protein [Proteus mirabilis]